MINKIKTPIGNWSVKYPDIILDIKTGKDNEEFGYCIPKNMAILIRRGMSANMAKQTLIHEIIHTIESQAGFDIKESTVDSLGTHLYYIIKNNPKLMEYLTND